jgi:hypothetical protein
MVKPGPVIPARYAEALGDDDPVELQRKAPKRIKKLIRGLSEKELARKPAPEKWSIKEVIAHLADGEFILGARMRFVAAHDRPPLPGYDQDLFVERLGVERVKTGELLEAFAAARSANVGLLRRLPEDAFARIGMHAERGEESIAQMVAMYAGHDRIHERQIEAIRAALAAKPKKARAQKELEPAEHPAEHPAKDSKRGRKKPAGDAAIIA